MLLSELEVQPDYINEESNSLSWAGPAQSPSFEIRRNIALPLGFAQGCVRQL